MAIGPIGGAHLRARVNHLLLHMHSRSQCPSLQSAGTAEKALVCMETPVDRSTLDLADASLISFLGDWVVPHTVSVR